MEDPLLPLEPTTQLPLIHLLRRHAPVARARPLSISPRQGVLLKPLTTCFFFFSFARVCFQDITPPAVKTLKTLTNKEVNMIHTLYKKKGEGGGCSKETDTFSEALSDFSNYYTGHKPSQIRKQDGGIRSD